jgi:hypothetical protein
MWLSNANIAPVNERYGVVAAQAAFLLTFLLGSSVRLQTKRAMAAERSGDAAEEQFAVLVAQIDTDQLEINATSVLNKSDALKQGVSEFERRIGDGETADGGSQQPGWGNA